MFYFSVTNVFCKGRNIKIRRDLQDVEATEGQPVTFECEISHDLVKARWYINNERVKDGDGIRWVCAKCTMILPRFLRFK